MFIGASIYMRKCFLYLEEVVFGSCGNVLLRSRIAPAVFIVGLSLLTLFLACERLNINELMRVVEIYYLENSAVDGKPKHV